MITTINEFNKIINNKEFIGIHCSERIFNDEFDGRIIDEYYSSFKNILELIKKDYNDAKIYLKQIELLSDGLNMEDDSIELIFDIESFLIDNNIEWIFVSNEALTKYGNNCYNVYFNNFNNVYIMQDELVENATIYIYDSKINKPILDKN